MNKAGKRRSRVEEKKNTTRDFQLNLKSRNAEVDGMVTVQIETANIKLPDEYRKMQSMPDDPPGSQVYGVITNEAECWFIMEALSLDKAMPMDDNPLVISSIHHYMDERQGLIEVESGKTSNGHRFIYSIVKTVMEGRGVQYSVNLQVEYNRFVVTFRGPCAELGTAGGRDAVVYEMFMRSGSAGQWMEDPYDPTYKNGVLMNLSEKSSMTRIFQSIRYLMRERFYTSLLKIISITLATMYEHHREMGQRHSQYDSGLQSVWFAGR